MTSAKTHIRTIVEQYIKQFPEEFEEFKRGMIMVRASLKDEEFGRVITGRNIGSETRALFEMPETLHTMLIMQLEEEEMVWLKDGGSDGKEGGRWFARTFKDFALPKKI